MRKKKQIDTKKKTNVSFFLAVIAFAAIGSNLAKKICRQPTLHELSYKVLIY